MNSDHHAFRQHDWGADRETPIAQVKDRDINDLILEYHLGGHPHLFANTTAAFPNDQGVRCAQRPLRDLPIDRLREDEIGAHPTGGLSGVYPRNESYDQRVLRRYLVADLLEKCVCTLEVEIQQHRFVVPRREFRDYAGGVGDCFQANPDVSQRRRKSLYKTVVSRRDQCVERHSTEMEPRTSAPSQMT